MGDIKIFKQSDLILDEWEWFLDVLCGNKDYQYVTKEEDMAIRQYQTVLWTHTADVIASKVKGV